MYLEGILSIAGKPGLYKMVNQARNSLIVESLDTKKRFPTFATAKISALEDIAIYTKTEEKPLVEVFNTIFELEEGKQTISHKSSNDELMSFMERIMPDYDKDRVRLADMKKLIQWYNILIEEDRLNEKAIEEYEKKIAEEEAEEEN
ncbi:MAG: DUF5606 domain-containing protein [Bacteroidales bacterium]|jgi:hypothetical protein|nr:DUF5606 domain-containing protein [Bacteroidales bacterium]